MELFIDTFALRPVLANEPERHAGARGQDGQSFVPRRETLSGSPPDVEGSDLDLTTKEIVGIVREGRRELP